MSNGTIYNPLENSEIYTASLGSTEENDLQTDTLNNVLLKAKSPRCPNVEKVSHLPQSVAKKG